MSERNPFQQNQPPSHSKGPLQCEEWEALLVDALDGTLKVEDKAVFTAHGSECPMCAEMLAQAKQGQEWMTFLHEEPPVPADLIAKIIGRTSGASLPELAMVGAAAQPVAVPVAHFTTRRTFRDARMLMTAAMAFFSLALSLSLFGVRLDTLRLADLKPSTLQTTIARQFYGAKKQMVSYYENIRLVYEVESKMRELRRDAETDQNTQPRKEEKQPSNPPADGHKTGGKLTTPNHPGMPGPVVAGPPALADLDQPDTEKAQNLRKEEVVEVNELVVKRTADQAERSLA